MTIVKNDESGEAAGVAFSRSGFTILVGGKEQEEEEAWKTHKKEAQKVQLLFAIFNDYSTEIIHMTHHNYFGPPLVFVEDLLSTGLTTSSFYLLVERGLPLQQTCNEN